MALNDSQDNEEVSVIVDLEKQNYEKSYSDRIQNIISGFEKAYGNRPQLLARSPGRVNLIGEHIDYEGYSVLPMAIRQDTIIAICGVQPNSEPNSNHSFPLIHIANVRSDVYPAFQFSADPDQEINIDSHIWANYFICGFKGVYDHLKTIGVTNLPRFGFNVLVDGIVPTGAGLSSSASLVCSSFIAVMKALGYSFSKSVIADCACKCERYIGTQSGGMDQAISVMAKSGFAKLIDFNPLKSTDVILPAGAVFVVANSLTVSNKAQTASTNYNNRVVECRLASMILAIKLGMAVDDAIARIATLKDFQVFYSENGNDDGSNSDSLESVVKTHLHDAPYTEDEISTIFNKPLSEIFRNSKTSLSVIEIAKSYKLQQRALHVYSESKRVHTFRQVAHSLDKSGSNKEEVLKNLGKLMNESHTSCSKLYECSCSELDCLVSTALRHGAMGSRLTGAGWGGCTVSLVDESHVPEFIRALKDEYYRAFLESGALSSASELDACIFDTKPSEGAAIFLI